MWRYTPIDALDLDDFTPVADPEQSRPRGHRPPGRGTAALGALSGSVLVHNGKPVPGVGTNAAGIAFGPASEVASADQILGSVQQGGDALVRLNDAFAPDAVVVDVPAGTRVVGPVLVVHWCDVAGAAVFPRLCVRAGEGAAVSVVEVFAGPAGRGRALIVPVTELMAEEEAALAYVSLQTLPAQDWSLARLSGRGSAARGCARSPWGSAAPTSVCGPTSRSTARMPAAKSSRPISATAPRCTTSAPCRTMSAPRTTSELLCQGAVAGTSRSVYSGLIRVHRGAVRSDARQTNHNLVLSEGAHADSVPNLDILENDVSCSHASTVGPVDEDQMYYIESRGVPPEEAEGLIVRGFFDAIVDRGPVPEATALLEREVHWRLDRALAARLEPARA